MATLTTAPKPDQLRCVRSARRAGVPEEQLRNLFRAGIALQDRQFAASAAARACDHPDGPTEVGYGGARGGGKSHWLLAQMVADDCVRFPGLKCLLLRKVGKANRENFEDLRRRLLGGVQNTYKRQEGVLVLPNDSRVVLGHFQNESDIDAYLGLEYDVIGVEEATTLTLAKYKDIRTCCRSSKDGWRPRMYSTTNPGGVGHSWYKAQFIEPFRKGRERETRFIPATVRDNRYVNPEYVSSTLESLTGWKRRAWLDGDWDIAAGQFFTNWRRDIHVREFDLQPHWRKVLALDYGFTHFTSAHLLGADGDGDLYIADEHAERGWLPQRHAPAIKALLERHDLTPEAMWKRVAGNDLFAQRGMEEGKAQTLAATYKELGLDFEGANDDRINGAGEWLSRLGDLEAEPPIRPRIFIHPRCARLIECLPALEHDPHRPEDVLKVDCDEEGQGGDDPYDSARYGVMAFWNPPRKENRVDRPAAGQKRRYGFA